MNSTLAYLQLARVLAIGIAAVGILTTVACDPERDIRARSFGRAEFVVSGQARGAHVFVVAERGGGNAYTDTAQITVYSTDGNNTAEAELYFRVVVSEIRQGPSPLSYRDLRFRPPEDLPSTEFMFYDGGDAPVRYELDTLAAAPVNTLTWTHVDHEARSYEAEFEIDYTYPLAHREDFVQVFGDDYPFDVAIRGGRLSFQLPREE